MLMLLRADVLAHECLSIHVVLEFFDSAVATLFSDGFDFIEPDICHLSCEAPARHIVLLTVGLLPCGGDQSHVLGADDPGLYPAAPGHLHVLAVGLQCLEDLNPVAFEKRAHRTRQNVVLLHVVRDRHIAILVALLGADKLISKVEKLFEAFACKKVV